MIHFFKIIFYQQYKWNLKYALSEYLASLQASGLIFLFIISNIVSVYWSIELIIGCRLISQNVAFILLLIAVVAKIFFSLLYLNRKKRYLEIYKKISKENIKLLGLTTIGIAYWYYFISIFIFAGISAIKFIYPQL